MTQYAAPHDVMSARARFPAGLEQPEGSLRFGADALLLAAFVTRHLEAKKHRYAAGGSLARSPGLTPVPVAELGSGCGAALLALALRCPQVAGLGLEREEPLVQAARRNARLLGLSGHVGLPDVSDLPDMTASLDGLDGVTAPSGQARFAMLDIADRSALAALAVPALPHTQASPAGARRLAGNQHIVMANPPYDTGAALRPGPCESAPCAETATPLAEKRCWIHSAVPPPCCCAIRDISSVFMTLAPCRSCAPPCRRPALGSGVFCPCMPARAALPCEYW
ncbi:hypothetical protein CNY67_00120 [Desulfovibrio sp. G11]|nr:hypothetical protein [Desulfovibrio sp. G11]ATD80007.1 hypothetical protein CNY67_00120 [Desulfovibrio sp. G11]